MFYNIGAFNMYMKVYGCWQGLIIIKNMLLCEENDFLLASQSDERDSKRDSLEEGELRDHRMEITIRNSPYRREDSTEDR